MSTRARVLALALLTAVVAVSSALAASSGSRPPAGRRTITVDKVGWATGPGDNFDVRYLADGNVVMGPEIDTPIRQSGAVCGVDPLHTWTVTLSADDQTMQLNPLGRDGCGDRVAVMQGTWTRAH